MNLISCKNLFYFNFGCAFSVYANAKEIKNVVNKIKDNNIPCVLKLENGKSDVSLAIANEAKVPIKTLYSCHNCSKQDFEKGVNFLSYIAKNLETLKEAISV